MFIQNLNKAQQEVLLKLASDLMISDGVIDQSEKELINFVKSQCTEGVSELENFNLSEIRDVFGSKKAKVSMLLELIGLAHADGYYGKEEKVFINEIASVLNINEANLNELENWVRRQLDLVNDSVMFMEE
ncbi:MAG TPA: TerB family tellurite resistance protein [Pseudoalteromonas sp.]|jgi:tellurite resistance protein|uniref:Co-chaperone DjlA N-terminal domain-containing protein n=2 Tax=root TaxID=1 RepID=A0A0F9VEG5_9ZZZZ|nr:MULTISPECIES: TerB family tellurite resistance protein [Pseudoalteromonas]SUC51648.1 Tellurite resistance protein [Pseudoalteromonas nigrifaciens]HDY93524.1 TerB family tellurite resistance protein [Pseudoalteromonas sp.]HDZ32656.1 TerB family tellurite resistance protein [Pseudoalteromonas sp.]